MRIVTHFGYILAAYLATAFCLAGTVAFVALDLRAARRRLARLEESGLRGSQVRR